MSRLPLGHISAVEDSLGTRLKMAMAFRGMSRKQIDIATGFTPGYTGRIAGGKRGQRPVHATIKRLADVLRVNANWLADGTGAMLDGVPDVVPEAQPNRVQVCLSEAFLSAKPEVQAWFTRLRKTPDLSPAEWQSVLESGLKLHSHGFLGVRAAGKKLE